MVHCSQCKTPNPPERDYCLHCQADLLPSPGASKRVWAAIRSGLIGLLILTIGLAPLWVWKDDPNAAACKSLSFLILLVGVVVLIRGLVRSFRPAPIYERYLVRAARHVVTDPDQALTDFVHGVMLAPPNVRMTLTRQVPKELKALVHQSGSTLASATSGYLSPEGIRKIIYSAYVTWAGLAETITEFGKVTQMGWQAGEAVAASSRLRKEVLKRLGKTFQELTVSGMVQELGYCPKCKLVVVCDAGGRCSCNHKHGNARGIVYVIPEDVELFQKRLKQVYAG